MGFRYNHSYDDEMGLLAKLATHHACNLVEEQYHASHRETYITSSDDDSPSFVTLSNAKSGDQYAVNLTENSCSCACNQTVLLPCRHIMYIRRKSSDARSIIPCGSITGRWLLVDEDEADTGASSITESFSVEDIEAPHTRVLGHNEKYRSGLQCARG